ncbi:hypothetical protein V8C86DRAFT_1592312 [Haematococcus lacustris]
MTPSSECARFVAGFLRVDPPAEDVPPAKIGSVCLGLTLKSSRAQQLLGASNAGRAQVDEWLLWSVSELNPLMDDKLAKINDHLASRTFLVGNDLTLADLVVFGVTHAATTSFPAAQILHFMHLLRWADLIQGIAGEALVAASFARGPVKVSKPQFVPPPPPPPPSPSATATGPAAATAVKQPAAAGSKPVAPAGTAPAPAAGGTAMSVPGGSAPDASSAKDKGAAKVKEGKGGAGEKGKGGKAGGGGGGDDEARIDMLDIRVGTIIKVGRHPNADALYVEEIDVGESAPRQIISGLVKFVPEEAMRGLRVLVVCNLKPAKMREVMSFGMVLCASNETHDQVVPVAVPEGVPNGERCTVEGYEAAPLEEVNPKKKILERLFPDMKTNSEGVPCYKGAVFKTSKGPVTSPLPDAWVK